MNLHTEPFLNQSIKSFCLWTPSCFCGSDCSSSPVVSSGPRTACWELCVEPDVGRPGPSLYTTPAVPQLGTLSAYSRKTQRTDVPEGSKTHSSSAKCARSCFVFDQQSFVSTHSVRLVHRLVVETRADDVKRCHGDGHGHAADHGGYQGREPGVRTQPLWTRRQIGRHSYFPCAVETSVTSHVYLGTRHPVFGGGEGRQLSSWSHHDTRHCPVDTPPETH